MNLLFSFRSMHDAFKSSVKSKSTNYHMCASLLLAWFTGEMKKKYGARPLTGQFPMCHYQRAQKKRDSLFLRSVSKWSAHKRLDCMCVCVWHVNAARMNATDWHRTWPQYSRTRSSIHIVRTFALLPLHAKEAEETRKETHTHTPRDWISCARHLFCVSARSAALAVPFHRSKNIAIDLPTIDFHAQWMPLPFCNCSLLTAILPANP